MSIEICVKYAAPCREGDLITINLGNCNLSAAANKKKDEAEKLKKEEKREKKPLQAPVLPASTEVADYQQIENFPAQTFTIRPYTGKVPSRREN